jgi:hypothetical protein
MLLNRVKYFIVFMIVLHYHYIFLPIVVNSSVNLNPLLLLPYKSQTSMNSLYSGIIERHGNPYKQMTELYC